LSHQRGKKQTKENKTTKHHKVSQVQMQYNFSKFFSMQVCSSVVVSSKEEKKKRVWRQICECLSEAVVTCLLLSASVAGGFIDCRYQE
jgi:hypothetical protein